MRRELAHYPKQYLCTYTTPLLQLTEKCHHCSWPIYLCTRTHSSEFFPQSKDKNECNKSVPFNSTPLPPLSLFLFCFKGSLDFFIAAAAMWLQSCLTLCDPTDGSPPGSSVPGTLQARILEWVAISFSNACMHAKPLQSCPTLCHPMDSSPPGSSVHGILQARILEWVAMSFIATSLNYHAPLVLRFVCFYLVLIRSLTFQNIGKVETLFQGDFLSNSN